MKDDIKSVNRKLPRNWSHTFMKSKYLFYTLSYKPIILYFIVVVVPALAIWNFVQCIVSFWQNSIIVGLACFFCFEHSYFLAQQEAPSSPPIFPALALESTISLRSPGFCFFFIGEWYQKPRSECLVCFLLLWVLAFCFSQQTRQRIVCVYTLPCILVYTSLKIFPLEIFLYLY